MTHQEILQILRSEDPGQLDDLWRRADQCRREHVGDEVHLRGLVEISNHCRRGCHYCGLRAANTALPRYRMSADEILAAADTAVELGYGTVVMQAGEDDGIDARWLADIVTRIKARTPLAVTLSLGERDEQELALWRAAGADRYLLRFETSNVELYRRLHPPRPGGWRDRVAILRRLGQMGYEVGSGVMVGLPGQTYDDLCGDIELFAELKLDMIGVGPFLPHPQTPLGQQATAQQPGELRAGDPGQLELLTYKMVALARLACPWANIPATTALGTLNVDAGRETALRRGANVVMPNLTPQKYRAMYEIYPNKICISETAEHCSGCLRQRIYGIGRTIGAGRGDSRRHRTVWAEEVKVR